LSYREKGQASRSVFKKLKLWSETVVFSQATAKMVFSLHNNATIWFRRLSSTYQGSACQSFSSSLVDANCLIPTRAFVVPSIVHRLSTYVFHVML
jgi:hypothetical protein